MRVFLLLLMVTYLSVAPAADPILIRVESDKPIASVDPEFYGGNLNYFAPEFSQWMASDAGRNGLQGLGLDGIRWPAGITAQYYIWSDPASSFRRRESLAPENIIDWRQAIDWCRRMNWRLLVQANTFRYAPAGRRRAVRIDPDDPRSVTAAADDVERWAIAVADTGFRNIDWEIGNEDWARLEPVQYVRLVQAYAPRIRRHFPDAKIAVNLLTGTFKSRSGGAWSRSVIHALRNTPSVGAISVHAYLPSESTPTSQELLGGLAQVGGDLSYVSELQKLLQAEGVNWEIWCTEFNIDREGPAGGSAGGSLWAKMEGALVIAEWVPSMVRAGVSRAYIQTLSSNPRFSIFEPGSRGRPSLRAEGLVYSAYAGMFKGDMVKVDVSGGGALVGHFVDRYRKKDPAGKPESRTISAVDGYAVREVDTGTVNVFVVNRDLSTARPVDLVVTDLGAKSYRFKTSRMWSSDSQDLQVVEGGARNFPDGSTGSQFKLQMPPASVAVLSFSQGAVSP